MKYSSKNKAILDGIKSIKDAWDYHGTDSKEDTKY